MSKIVVPFWEAGEALPGTNQEGHYSETTSCSERAYSEMTKMRVEDRESSTTANPRHLASIAALHALRTHRRGNLFFIAGYKQNDAAKATR